MAIERYTSGYILGVDDGFSKELGINLPQHVIPYADGFYGIYKDVVRKIEFKIGPTCCKELVIAIEEMIFMSIKTGIQYQKNVDYDILVKSTKEIDRLNNRIKRFEKSKNKK